MSPDVVVILAVAAGSVVFLGIRFAVWRAKYRYLVDVCCKYEWLLMSWNDWESVECLGDFRPEMPRNNPLLDAVRQSVHQDLTLALSQPERFDHEAI